MAENGEAAEQRGLTAIDAARRLAADGPNELRADSRRSGWRLAVQVVREPMFLLLLAAGLLYLLMGEGRDAALLMAFVLVVIAITFVQERRTERALEALRRLASPRARVIRDGIQQRIPGREVVVGDLLVVSEGDRVAADAELRRSSHLSVDESLLTGESVPVEKRLVDPGPGRPLQDPAAGVVRAGTLIVAGHAVCEVTATGEHTEFGRLGRSLDQLSRGSTPLQVQTAALVRALAVAGGVACLAVAVVYGLTRGNDLQAWRDGGLAGIAMAMAMLPEEFPVVLTVFLALGAWRLGRRNVLTRRLPAIETLGAATVLCVDKTGTLTCNEMRVVALQARAWPAPRSPAGAAADAPERELLRAARLASRTEPFDPMERALHAAGDAASVGVAKDARLLREYPLTANRPAVAQAWHVAGRCEVACKGAPEAVASLCGLSDAEQAALTQRVDALASQGLRVIALAATCIDAVVESRLPADPAALGLQLLGLVAFADPLRQEVPGAVAECRSAGIRVVMITGDFPATAVAVARQAGIDSPEAVVTGAQLDALSDLELAARLATVNVFARIAPRQKLRIVSALQACGEVVAMTGDGVNDAPALKAAHIGVAMGARGSDVAREAADIVLLDDSFASMVESVRLGRQIYANIRKASAFIIAVHVPIAGLSLLPVLAMDWPLLLLPIHIVFLELVIDPTCALVFEAERGDGDLMRRPPRASTERLLSGPVIGVSLLQGGSVLAACVAVFLLGRQGHPPETARALTFAALVVSTLALIVVKLSDGPTTWRSVVARRGPFWFVAGGALGLLALALGVPQVREIFAFGALHAADLLFALTAGLACLVAFELLKRAPRWGTVSRDSAGQRAGHRGADDP